MGVVLLYADEWKTEKLRERLEPAGVRCVTKPLAEDALNGDPGAGATIVWGEDVSALLPQHEYVLNRPAVARRSETTEKLAPLLHMHGIATAYTRHSNNPEGVFPFHYRVPVFHLEALTLFSAESNAAVRLPMSARRRPSMIGPVFAETGLDRLDKRGTSAIRAAVKAIYALGLDYGVVDIVLPPSGSPEVLKVEPYPELDDRLAELYAEAIRKFGRELESDRRRLRAPLLGADPEFLLADEAGRIVHASRYLPKIGEAGCDVLTIRGVKRYPLAELRPEPAADPRRLLRHLRRAMLHAAEQITDERLRWVAGGMPATGFALGGHLHISQVWLNSRLLRALDNYLALPLAMVEAERSARRRPAYGYLGDFRRKKHGGFEYRTLPSWLASPHVAKGVIACFALIAAHYQMLSQRPLQDPVVQKRFYAGDKEALLPYVRRVWEDLKRLPGYAALSDWLIPYEQSIMSRQVWDEHADIRPAWKISSPVYESQDPSIRAIIGTGVMNAAGGGER
ncbi:putative amidoligase domain-containing protein [Paenibacillus sp. HJGM_3]|uniref:putative amidoligase domain-containing protein n=1 Tax=Paenibacillus sp. HJGM_3 TaxID=3379816 RepID=UPI00385B3D23